MGFFDDIIESITHEKELGKAYADIIVANELLCNKSIKVSEQASKITSLNDLVYQLRKTDDGKAERIIALTYDVESERARSASYLASIAEANGSIESLKCALAMEQGIEAPSPMFLDQSLAAYRPYRQVIEPDGKLGGFNIDPREMYVIPQVIKELVLRSGWRKLSKFEKLVAAWNYVTDKSNRVYYADTGDNWQFAVDTIYRRRGDCEDSTTLLLTLWRALGVRPDECFNAVGPTDFGYHSYAIAWLKAGEGPQREDGWYVFETTLNGTMLAPVKLLGSPYRIDEGGLSNWAFTGRLKKDAYPLFNSIAPAYMTGATIGVKPIEPERIDNSTKKLEAIEKYWAEHGFKTSRVG